MKPFKGRVSSRSSANLAGPPGERAILELNPERYEKLLELTGWSRLESGTLNLEVADAVVDGLLQTEPLWVEDASRVRYPMQWSHIPRRREAYLYYEATASAHEREIEVLVRRARIPVRGRVELYADKSIRHALLVSDGDEIKVGPSSGHAILNDMREAWAGERRFFSNAGKEERECWVVAEFLRLRGIDFQTNEVSSAEQDHFVDVKFRDAKFQVKELLTPGSLRQAEIATTHEQLLSARRLQDAIGPGFVYDTPTVEFGDVLVGTTVAKLAQDPRYLHSKAQTDLILYVTHTRVTPPRTWTPDWSQLSPCGWRSVSCLISDQALVLFASETAPTFLRPP